MTSRHSSESGRFQDMCRKSQRSLSRFPRLWNATESPAKIASFSRSIYLKSHLWIACWIAFLFMDRLPPPSFSPRPYLRGRHRFRGLLLARTQNVREIDIVFGEADPPRACVLIRLKSPRNGQYFRPDLSRHDFRRIARGRRGRGHRRLPAEHRTIRIGNPTGAGPPPSGPK